MSKSRRASRKCINDVDEEPENNRRSNRLAKKFNFNKVYTEKCLNRTTVNDEDDVEIIDKRVYDEALMNRSTQKQKVEDSDRLEIVESSSNNNELNSEYEDLSKLFPLYEQTFRGGERVSSQRQRSVQLQSVSIDTSFKRKVIQGEEGQDTQQRIKKKLKVDEGISLQMQPLYKNDYSEFQVSEGNKSLDLRQPVEQRQQQSGQIAEKVHKSVNEVKSNEISRNRDVEIEDFINKSMKQLEMMQSQDGEFLRQRVAKQIYSLLEEYSVSERQIINEDSLRIEQPEIQQLNMYSPNSAQFSCAECIRNRAVHSQMTQLFNELLQKEIDLDQLFIEQELLLIMDQINSSDKHSCCKLSKLVDVTDNRLLCELIAAKISRMDQQDELFGQYQICKIVRVNSSWIAILRVRSAMRTGKEHFKYLGTDELLLRGREWMIDFLMR